MSYVILHYKEISQTFQVQLTPNRGKNQNVPFICRRFVSSHFLLPYSAPRQANSTSGHRLLSSCRGCAVTLQRARNMRSAPKRPLRRRAAPLGREAAERIHINHLPALPPSPTCTYALVALHPFQRTSSSSSSSSSPLHHLPFVLLARYISEFFLSPFFSFLSLT